MLSRFSCVRLFVTLWTVAHQTLVSMGFSSQARIIEWVAVPSSGNPVYYWVLNFILGPDLPCKLQADKSNLLILHLYLEVYQVSQNRLLISVPKPNSPTPLISQVNGNFSFSVVQVKNLSLCSPLLSSHTPHLISENPFGSSFKTHLDSNNFSPYLPPLRSNYFTVLFLQ